LARVCDILNQHNVALEQWFVLESLEHANSRRGIVRKAAESAKRFGRQLTSTECCSHLATCLRNGWLREVDDEMIAEVRHLAHADSAVMPVPFDPVRQMGGIDFSADGAQLYRTLSTEILGQGWEDCLCLENTYFREEHRYCATRAGVEATLREYEEAQESPTSQSLHAIGPWCVYWWERFNSGYRLQLQFGERPARR
jgi:hypothetical protein